MSLRVASARCLAQRAVGNDSQRSVILLRVYLGMVQNFQRRLTDYRLRRDLRIDFD